MNNYLLPYVDTSGPMQPKFTRKILGDTKRVYIRWNVWKTEYGGWIHTSNTFIEYDTKEKCMKALDQQLIDDGWVLISWERAEKLKALL